MISELDSMVKKATISLADMRLTLAIHKYDDSPRPVAIAVADGALPSFESLGQTRVKERRRNRDRKDPTIGDACDVLLETQ